MGSLWSICRQVCVPPTSLDPEVPKAEPFPIRVTKLPLLLLLLLFRYTLITTAAAVAATRATRAAARIRAICTPLLALLLATILASLLALFHFLLLFLSFLATLWIIVLRASTRGLWRGRWRRRRQRRCRSVTRGVGWTIRFGAGGLDHCLRGLQELFELFEPILRSLILEFFLELLFHPLKDRKSTRLNSSHLPTSRMPSSA